MSLHLESLIMGIGPDCFPDTVDYQLAAAFAGHNCAENYLRIQVLYLLFIFSLMSI
jgi:hypothetical protein